MSWVTLLRGTNGLNNAVDPVRLGPDKDGATPLAVAYNVNIDPTGRLSRRRGYVQKRAEASHSGFCQGGDCLFVAGDSLYRLNPDYSRTLLREGLQPDARMAYVQIAGRIYYSNEYQKGYVPTGGTDQPWVAAAYDGPTTRKRYHDPPTGHLLAAFDSCLLVAKGGALYRSERFQYGWFRRYGFVEPQRLTLLQPVPGGLFVGTATQTCFYAGDTIDALQRRVLANFGAIEGTVAVVPSALLGLDALGPQVWLWATTEGLCVGGAGGYFRNLTDAKLKYPAANSGCGLVMDHTYLVLLDE